MIKTKCKFAVKINTGSSEQNHNFLGNCCNIHVVKCKLLQSGKPLFFPTS